MSSHPPIEQNLIEHNLWTHDGSFQPAFIYQDEPRLWADLYHSKHAQQLYCYKQADQRLASGFSMPTDYAGYRVVYSFGFRSADITIEQQVPNQLKIPAGAYYATAPVMLAEMFPINLRCTVLSVLYSIAASLSAGLAPLISLILVKKTDLASSPSILVFVLAAATFIIMGLKHAKRNTRYQRAALNTRSV